MHKKLTEKEKKLILKITQPLPKRWKYKYSVLYRISQRTVYRELEMFARGERTNYPHLVDEIVSDSKKILQKRKNLLNEFKN